MVRMKVRGHPMTFIVDIGAEYSVVTTSVAPFCNWKTTVVGATGNQVVPQPFCQDQICQLWGQQVCHEFLYLLECSVRLLGRDLLRAQITFKPGGPASLILSEPMGGLVQAVTLPHEEEWKLHTAEKSRKSHQNSWTPFLQSGQR